MTNKERYIRTVDTIHRLKRQMREEYHPTTEKGRFKFMIDRLREMEQGKLGLSKETLLDLDRFFREQILYTDALTDAERGEVIEYYLKSA